MPTTIITKMATIISLALARASASMMSLLGADELADDDPDQCKGHRRHQRSEYPGESRRDNHRSQDRPFAGAEQTRRRDLIAVDRPRALEGIEEHHEEHHDPGRRDFRHVAEPEHEDDQRHQCDAGN